MPGVLKNSKETSVVRERLKEGRLDCGELYFFSGAVNVSQRHILEIYVARFGHHSNGGLLLAYSR